MAQAANLANRKLITRKGGPQIMSTNDGLIIKNQELFASYNSSSGANGITFVGMNPGDPNVFSWLSAISGRYGYYRWKKLRVVWVSGTSTGLDGDVTMGTFFDYDDANNWFTGGSIAGLTQTSPSASGPVWGSSSRIVNGRLTSDMSYDIDVSTAHMRTPWHIVDRVTGSVAVDNQSVAVYFGLVLTPNGVGTKFAGRVWFDYEIELRHPTATASNASLMVRGGPAWKEVPASPDGTPLPDPKPDPVPRPKPDTDGDEPCYKDKILYDP